jgi:hypothetical protein
MRLRSTKRDFLRFRRARRCGPTPWRSLQFLDRMLIRAAAVLEVGTRKIPKDFASLRSGDRLRLPMPSCGSAKNWPDGKTKNRRKLLKRLAPQAGFEPATLRLTGGHRCSDSRVSVPVARMKPWCSMVFGRKNWPEIGQSPRRRSLVAARPRSGADPTCFRLVRSEMVVPFAYSGSYPRAFLPHPPNPSAGTWGATC